MRFKRPELSAEFDAAPKVLKAIMLDIDDFCREFFGIETTVTRIRESFKGEKTSVHALGRAIDFRDEYLGELTFNLEQRAKLLKYVNEKYVRSDGFKTLIHHRIKGNPYHFHLQAQEKWCLHEKIF